MENNQQNIIRKILLSEVTWIIMILGGGWGVVTQVVLPINTIQIQLTQISMDMNQTKKDYQVAMQEHINLRDRVSVLETKINQ